MSIGLTDILIASMATWQAVEVWRHGSIFASARATAQAWTVATGVRGWLGRLLSCPFCLSVWVALATVLLWTVGHYPGQILVATLAAARLANVGNDLTHPWCRTPRPPADDA